MSRPTAWIKRSLIFVHRWLGVALSVIFLLWFASGIVMMYWSFPDVTARDRLERAPVLRFDRIAITAEQAYAALERDEPPTQVRLTTFDGRPVYRFGGGGPGGGGRRPGSEAIVYADDGSVQRVIDAAMPGRVASGWTGLAVGEARKEDVTEVDQWTVGGLRGRLPLQKYSWPDGQQVYVSPVDAEVVQYTTRASRAWAYLGAIPHWLYFTPLRRNAPQWFSFVVWSSLIGTVAALIGLTVAIWMFSPRQRYRHAGEATSIPYTGWKRWHTIAGLCFGVVTTTWTFSGLLSMGPFPIMDRLTVWTIPSASGRGSEGNQRPPGARLDAALRGRTAPLSSYAERHPRDVVAALDGFDVKDIEFTTFDGAPVFLASNGRETRVVPLRGAATPAFATEDVTRIVREAAGASLAELRLMHEYDAYYLDRLRERPLPVVYVRLNDAATTRYYVDPATARIVGSYSARGWVNRWLYHGLHSLDFPWLYKYRPLWDIVVITLMLGGTALCMTSIILTWRVLARKLAALRGRVRSVDEDLATDPTGT